MIVLKTAAELSLMRDAGRISAEALRIGAEAVRPGATTREVDEKIHRYILSQNATPSFLGYGGFPASACISVNEEVIHGVPGSRVLVEGDIVSIDVGACYKGYHGDNALTVACGSAAAADMQLMDVTRECLNRAIERAVVGGRIGDISHAVQAHAESFGYGVVRQYVGHGVGKSLHEQPEVANFGKAGKGIRLVSGMTLAIEPMINLSGEEVRSLPNGTVVTASGSVSAHFEHTIAITPQGPVILTQV